MVESGGEASIQIRMHGWVQIRCAACAVNGDAGDGHLRQLGRMSPSKHECMEGAHVTSHYRGGSADSINDIVPLCGTCNYGAGKRHQMLWIEDQCRQKKVDWKEDVIYMYYRDLVKVGSSQV